MRRPIFDCLCSSRNKLKRMKSSVLQGFSHALVHFGENERHRSQNPDASAFTLFILRRYSRDPRPMNFAFFHTKGATGLLLTSPQRSDPGPRRGSVVVHRADVFGQSLAVMAGFAHRLPVGFVPEKSGIATVRCDMVHHGGFRISPLPHALGAERMGLEVLPAYFLPLPCIATLTRGTCDFGV